MRTPALAVFLCAGALPVLALPVTSELTLVTNEPGFNAVNIAIDVPVIGGSSDTSDLTGNVEVALELDPIVGQVSELTVLSGNVTGSGVTLARNIFVASYSLSASSIGATIATPDPPGVVTPATGEFDAAQHTFTVNSGTLSGSVRQGFETTPVSVNFMETPVTGPGAGSGNVTLTETSSTATTKTFLVTVVLPVSVVDQYEATPGQFVDVSAVGTVKATGSVTVPSTLYGIWAAENAIPEALFADDDDGDGVANGLQWALGLMADELPAPHLMAPASGGFEIVLPAGGSAGTLTVLVSSDPATVPFTPVDGAAVSVGNPIPAGTTGTVTVAAAGNSGFLRLQASE